MIKRMQLCITTKPMANQNNTTAVGWLREQVQSNLSEPMSPKFAELFEEAREMEREQIKEAWEENIEGYELPSFEEYYQQRYGKSE
jgi:hypothetical protein